VLDDACRRHPHVPRHAHRGTVLCCRTSAMADPLADRWPFGDQIVTVARTGTQQPEAHVNLTNSNPPNARLAATGAHWAGEMRSEQVFRAAWTSAPDAIVAVRASGEIEMINPRAETLFGWVADELVGQPIETLLPETAVEAHRGLRGAFLGDCGQRSIGSGPRLLGRRRDHSTFPAEVTMSTVTNEAGYPLVFVTARDMTAQLGREDEIRRQAFETQGIRSHRLESLGQLATGVAHDFNNLIAVITSYTTLVGRRVTEPMVLADLAEINAAAERAAGLTHQLVAFARQDVADPQSLEVNEIVEAVATMLSRTLGEQIAVCLLLEDGPLVAVADRYHVEQIVINLAINARDAMPAGGKLTITSGRSELGGEIVLKVIDTGSGMTPEILARAFEPFYTTKPRGEGSGLGLATVHGIVDQNGGDVTIHSTIGSGTTVTVRLPRVDDVLPIKHPVIDASPGGTERVLLVEDDESLRVSTARLLAERGYDVIVASDGIEALTLFDLQQGAVTLVLSDVGLPRMGGEEMARQLIERDPNMHIIFLSGYNSSVTPLLGRLLVKPVAEATLLRTIREMIDG
jgi:PAS domain S-box-containing protein